MKNWLCTSSMDLTTISAESTAQEIIQFLRSDCKRACLSSAAILFGGEKRCDTAMPCPAPYAHNLHGQGSTMSEQDPRAVFACLGETSIFDLRQPRSAWRCTCTFPKRWLGQPAVQIPDTANCSERSRADARSHSRCDRRTSPNDSAACNGGWWLTFTHFRRQDRKPAWGDAGLVQQLVRPLSLATLATNITIVTICMMFGLSEIGP